MVFSYLGSHPQLSQSPGLIFLFLPSPFIHSPIDSFVQEPSVDYNALGVLAHLSPCQGGLCIPHHPFPID